MASKQLGKLRQWAGEVISARERTSLTDEFKDLERDIECRRAGIERIHKCMGVFLEASMRKGDDLSVLDAVGVAMVYHGHEYGEISAYGQSLCKFGRAQSKIASLQENFAINVKETFFDGGGLGKDMEKFKEYGVLRKKLDSRRLAYDAAVSKASKAKKEKDKVEAEEEVDRAKERYEEISSEILSRMKEIQDAERQQLADLTELMELEVTFFEECKEVMMMLKEGWIDESQIRKVDVPRPKGPSHLFNDPLQQVAGKQLKVKRRKSIISNPDPPPAAEDSESERERERPASKASKRERADSTASGNGSRLNITGWVRSRTGSMRGSKSFKHLSEADNHEEGEKRNGSPKSTTSSLRQRVNSRASSVLSLPSSHSQSQGSKRPSAAVTVKVLYDYSAMLPEELSLRADDEVVVISEGGREGWCVGELRGRSGLFPLNFTEDLPPHFLKKMSVAPAPPLPPSKHQHHYSDDSYSDGDEGDEAQLFKSDKYHVEDEPFGDHHSAFTLSHTSVIEEEDRLHPNGWNTRHHEEDIPVSPNIPMPHSTRLSSIPALPRRKSMPGKRPPPPPPPPRTLSARSPFDGVGEAH